MWKLSYIKNGKLYSKDICEAKSFRLAVNAVRSEYSSADYLIERINDTRDINSGFQSEFEIFDKDNDDLVASAKWESEDIYDSLIFSDEDFEEIFEEDFDLDDTQVLLKDEEDEQSANWAE